MKLLSQRSLVDSPEAAAIVPEIERRRLYCDAIDRSAAILRQLAPQELAGRAVYIVPFIREPSDGPHVTCKGYTDADLDLQLQPFLESQGVWQGRGFATVFDLAVFESDLCVPPLSIGSDMRRFAVHEYGHNVDAHRANPAVVERPREELPPQWRSRRPTYGPIDRQNPEHSDYDPFYLHGLSWVRATLHLMYRADQAGLSALTPLAVDLMLGGHSCLEDQWGYVEALGSELRQCLDQPLREVLAQPLPDPFLILHCQDRTKWKVQRQAKRAQTFVPSGSARDRRRARRRIALAV